VLFTRYVVVGRQAAQPVLFLVRLRKKKKKSITDKEDNQQKFVEFLLVSNFVRGNLQFWC
jgi:hypothetical protein